MTANLWRVIGMAALAASGQVSFAATYSYEFSTEFSGAQAPAGPAPWATLSFSDVAGGVSMNVSLSGMTGSEFLGSKGLYVNFGPNPGDAALATRLAGLSFAYTAGQAAQSIGTGLNNFKADGDGYYDINFRFASSGANRFSAGEQTAYLITGSSVTAADFNFQSSPGGGNGLWYSAMHVQNTTGAGQGGSGWISPIPEPQTYAMLLAGLGLMGFVVRHRQRNLAAA